VSEFVWVGIDLDRAERIAEQRMVAKAREVVPGLDGLPLWAMRDGAIAEAIASMLGVLSSQTVTTEVGNVGAGEDDLMSYVLPANTLNANGRALRITAFGSFGATANAKILRFYFGPSGAQILSASPNNISWMAQITLIRNTATLHYLTSFAVFGGGAQVPTMSAIGNAADATTPITIKFTGEGVADNDIKQRAMLIELLR
jgi:hypothetical protein